MFQVQTLKCLNGLKQAPCAWFAVSALVFSAWGSIKVFMIQHSSPCIPMQAFFYNNNNNNNNNNYYYYYYYYYYKRKPALECMVKSVES